MAVDETSLTVTSLTVTEPAVTVTAVDVRSPPPPRIRAVRVRRDEAWVPWHREGMRVNLPGQPEHRPTSLSSPLCQLALTAALLIVALGAYLYAPRARVTDIWLYNALSAVTALAGLLFLPFALAAFFAVLRNRRS